MGSIPVKRVAGAVEHDRLRVAALKDGRQRGVEALSDGGGGFRGHATASRIARPRNSMICGLAELPSAAALFW